MNREEIHFEHIVENEPMSRHTTFRTGGPARWFCPVSSVSDICAVIAFAREQQKPLYVIGRGSNLLVSDLGIDGVVMEIADGFRDIRVEGERITAEAGASLSAVAAKARDAGLAGMAFASGIPGTLGGGISMNAGAYGGEMKDIVETVQVLDLTDPENTIRTLAGEELQFSYRNSRCHREPLLILGATLKLVPGDKAQIAEEMQELNRRRREKQPLEYPSAGSTFKRPEGYFAGKLIQDAGLRGYSVGDAAVSEKHCGFVINKGNATSDDIYRLIRHVEAEVKKTFGVQLETEVRLLGEFE
ncbi:MAG: UDP-N-acetylmuramate dehydrogenase [Eubacterium sp.]|nr:UDP-N-acetylmuramate dehydrogenase [Eubacterium sp.]